MPTAVVTTFVWSPAVGSQQTVAITVDPSFTFTVASHTGACNGVSQSAGVSTSAAAVALGHISSSSSVGAQDLSVATNVGNGFTVFARSTGALGQIDDVAGSNASPVAFPASTEAFGYTTSDSTLGTGTANRFTSGGAKWAALTGTSSEVSSNTGPVTGDVVCVAYQAAAVSTTPAGTYSTSVIYTALPTF